LPAEPAMDKKTFRRLRSAIIADRGNVLTPLEDRIAALEEEIVAAETRLEELNEQMQAASNNGDGTKIVELSQAIHRWQRRIDDAFEALESATAEADQKRDEFDARLAELENRKPF